MQVQAINNTNNTNFKGRFIKNELYNALISPGTVNEPTLRSFEKTVQIIERVRDGKVFKFSDCESLVGSKHPYTSHMRYYLEQFEETDKGNFSDIDPFSKKIIGEVNNPKRRGWCGTILYEFNEILRKRYRPYFSYDNALKEDIFKLMENGKFENNSAIKDALNLPYTTREQLLEFKNNLFALSKIDDGKKFFVRECECFDSGNQYFSLNSVGNGKETLYTNDKVIDDGKNNVLDNINLRLNALIK